MNNALACQLNFDETVKSSETPHSVIPAKAGI